MLPLQSSTISLHKLCLMTKSFALRDKLLSHLHYLGFSADEANSTVISLLLAERAGHSTHGLNRIFSGFISECIANRYVTPHATPIRLNKATSTNRMLIYDGNQCLGYHGIWRMLDDIVTESTHGQVVFAHVFNLYPTNCLFEYALQLTKMGLWCFITSKSPKKVTTAIDLSRDPVKILPAVGTNAYCWAFPSNPVPLIFDTTPAAATNGLLLQLHTDSSTNFDETSFLTSELRHPIATKDLFNEQGVFTGFILPGGRVTQIQHKCFGALLPAEFFNIFHNPCASFSTTIIAGSISSESYLADAHLLKERIRNSTLYGDGSTARVPFDGTVERLLATTDEDILLRYEEAINQLSSLDVIPVRLKSTHGLSSISSYLPAPHTIGDMLLRDARVGSLVTAIGASTPFRSLILEQAKGQYGWISSFEVSSMLGENDDESIGFEEIDFFVSRIQRRCPSLRLIIDCDTCWSDDPSLIEKTFVRWRHAAALVMQNVEPSSKVNSFRENNMSKLHPPSIVAEKLKALCRACPESLIVIRLENLILGEDIEDAVSYLKEVLAKGAPVHGVSLHSKTGDVGQQERFLQRLVEELSNAPLLFLISTAFPKDPMLLSRTGARVIIHPNYVLRAEAFVAEQIYSGILSNDFSMIDRTCVPVPKVFSIIDNSSSENRVDKSLLNLVAERYVELTGDSILVSELVDSAYASSSEQIQFFNEWAPAYKLNELLDHKRLRQSVVSACAVSSTDSVIDIGSGNGSIIMELTDYSKLTLLDLSAAMLDCIPYELQRNPKIDFLVGNLLQHNAYMEYDVAIALMSMHHINDEEKADALQNIYRWLKPGGRFTLGETFLDVSRVTESESTRENIATVYLNKMINCFHQGLVGHARKELNILRRILGRDGEFMLSRAHWEKLLEDAGFSIEEVRVTSPLIQYGYILCRR